MDNLSGLIAILFATVLFTYLTGTIFVRFGNSQFNYYNLFFKVLIGAFAITIGYALIKSRFTSIYTVIFPPLIYYFIKIRKEALNPFTNPIQIAGKTVLKEILTLAVLSIVSFLILGLYTINKEDFSVDLAYYDYHFYSEIARGLVMKGQENFNIRFYPLYQSDGTTLYHYFDLWMTALLSETTGVDTFSLLLVVVYPLFFLLTVLGIMSLLQHHVKKNIGVTLLGLLVTVAISFEHSTLVDSKLLYLFNTPTPTNYLAMKLLHTYPVFILALHMFIRKNINAAVLILLSLSLLYSTLLVSILPGITILSAYIYLKNKKRDSFILLSLTITGLVCILYATEHNNVATEAYISILKSIKTSLIVSIEYIIKYALAYLPALILLIIAIREKKSTIIKENKELFIFVFTTLLTSLCFISIFHGTRDFSQALSNLIPGLVIMLTTLAILNLKINAKLYAFLSMFALLNLYSYIAKHENHNKLFSKEYREDCLNVISKSKNNRYLIYSEKGIRWRYNFHELARFTSFLKNIPSGFNIAFDFEPFLSKYNRPTPFRMWCLSNNLPVNENSLTTYMDENKIGFIFMSTLTPAPFKLENNFSKLYEDSISKEVLLMRKI
jgi:hypothetical protein